MHIALIGASGRTGTIVLDELLRRDHTVTALVRDPTKLTTPRDGLTVITGDSRDPEAVARLVDGAGAVLSALGPTARESSLHTDTAGALIATMDIAGVTRFVGVSGAGIDVPGDQKSLSARLISKVIQTFGGAVVRDKPTEYAAYAASDLDWTLVRPPRLTEGAATGRLEHHAHHSTSSTKITRADLATFLVEVAEQGLYIRQAPFVATVG